MKTAIYPGSFDPITLGHLNIIRRASGIFERVVVCIMPNAGKLHPMFTREERVALARRVVSRFHNVEVDTFDGLLAEYDNYRRRSTREREAIYADVRCDTLKKFLPVYDSLSRALAQTPDDDPARKGLEGIMNQYNTALTQLGVTAIEAVGQPFDANRHNAVMHIEDDAYGEGVVVEEFEKGFCIGDRVLRYSVVKVAN